jgi:REP element-mobilizing transposase RayT
MRDNIHLFIKSSTNTTISSIVQQLKKYISYIIRKKIPLLKKYKSLWTHSYFTETIRSTNEEAIKKYIENQKNI